jgi:hypothetical protein
MDGLKDLQLYSTPTPTEEMPRYIRVYDNGGKTLDRYTVVFTKKKINQRFLYLGMNSSPFHGFGQHGESDFLIDRPGYSHLGKKITFDALPDDCKKCVVQTYNELWRLNRSLK